MNRAAWMLNRQVQGFVCDSYGIPLRIMMPGISWICKTGFHMLPIQICLMDCLVIRLPDPFLRTVSGEHDQWYFTEESLSNSRGKIQRCGARSTNQGHWFFGLSRHSQRSIGGRSFIRNYIMFYPIKPHETQCNWGAS